MKSKKIVRALSLFAAVAITISMASAGVASCTSEAATCADTTKDVQESGAAGKREFKEGEAIVLLQSSISKEISGMSTSQADKTLDFAGDIKVTEKYDFGSYREDIETNRVARPSSEHVRRVNIKVLKVTSSGQTTAQILRELKKDSRVAAVMPNYRLRCSSLTNDTYSDAQWGLDRIDIGSIWEGEGGTTGSDKVAAVIDTGIDYTHEDLKNCLWRNTSSRLAGKYGYDFVNMDGDPFDDNGHGTHCAGIIGAAGNNHKGISGVNQHIRIMALKFLDESGYGDTAGAIGAYEYVSRAQDLGVDVAVINNSWGYSRQMSDDDEWDDEDPDENCIFGELMNVTGSKGAVSIWAAGNSGEEIGSRRSTLWGASEYGISVAALGSNGRIASYSNRGADATDIAAPGSGILSTVPYDCFNPSAYPKDKAAKLCSTLRTFENDEDVPQQPEIRVLTPAGSDCKVIVERSDEASFRGKSSLKFNIRDSSGQEPFAVGIPYNTGDASEPEISMMLASSGKFSDSIEESSVCIIDGSSSISRNNLISLANESSVGSCAGLYNQSDDWTHITFTAEDASAGEERYIYYVFFNERGGDFSLFIDDFGVSCGSVQSADFGRYDYFSGTSMAAPFVAGAIALAKVIVSDAAGSGITRGEIALAAKNAIFDNAAHSSLLETSVGDGRTLNMKSIAGSPIIMRMSMDSSKNIVISGKGFADTDKILVNRKNLTADSKISKSKIVIPARNYANRNVDVRVENPLGFSSSKTIAFYNKSDYTCISTDLSLVAGTADTLRLFSDGASLYAASTSDAGVVIDKYSTTRKCFRPYISPDMCDDDEDEDEGDDEGDDEDEDADGPQAELTGRPAICDGRVYMLQRKYEPSVSGAGFAPETRLVAFELKKYGKLISDTALPPAYDSILTPALGAYNGKIYLAGGFNRKTGKTTGMVYKYNPKTGKWSSCASMPSGRYGGSMVQCGNTLVYAMGADETGNVPRNLIYSGKSWRISKRQLTGLNYIEEDMDGKAYKYYDGEISLIKDGVVMTGVLMSGLGDTVKYNPSKDAYIASKYEFIRDTGRDSFKAATAGSYIYGIGAGIGSSALYRSKVSGGCVRASGKFRNGKVANANKYVLPGTLLRLRAVPSRGCYLKNFKVDGKKIKGSIRTVRITENIKVSASFGKYVSRIKLNKKSARIKSGKTLKLKAKVLPKGADDKSLKWSSSNRKYATVTSQGLVKAKKEGTGRVVRITAAARDGSGLKAVCKVTIK